MEKIFGSRDPIASNLTIFRNQPTGSQHLVTLAALKNEKTPLSPYEQEDIMVLELARTIYRGGHYEEVFPFERQVR